MQDMKPIARKTADELICEYLIAIDEGGEPEREPMLHDHPRAAAQLRQFFHDLDEVHSALADSNNRRMPTTAANHAVHRDAAGSPAAGPDRDDSQVPIGSTARRLGRFQLLEQIGGGTYGAVWKARDTEIDRLVALKVPHLVQGDTEKRQRFLREARAAGRLKHPNIVRLHEIGEVEGTVFIVSAYIDGHTLAQWRRDREPTPREATEVCAKLAEAIQHAHDAGVIHRDLKPSNVMIDKNGRPLITDFGLAKIDADDRSLTVEGQIVGTPAYMAPEQASGHSRHADVRSDVYALGVIYYHLLTGETPFHGDVHRILEQVLYKDPPSPRQVGTMVTRDQEVVCLKCLEKSPEKRYPTAAAVGDDLHRILRGEPIRARPIGRTVRTIRWCRRYPAKAATVSLLLFVSITAPLVAINQAALRTQLDTQEKETRRLLYMADMNLAQHAWENHDILRVTQLLARYYPVAAGSEDLRRFEWYYLWSLCNGQQKTLHGHSDRVLAVAYSPDGDTLISGGQDHTVRLWDVATGQQQAVLKGHGDAVEGVCFAPDGKTFATCSGDTVKIWDTEARRVKMVLSGHRDWVVQVSYSPDGRTLATASRDGSVKLWNVASGQEVATLSGHAGRVHAVAFSPTGKTLASGGSDGIVRLWGWSGGNLQATLSKHTDAIYSVAFSADGHLLASGSQDRSIILWDAKSGGYLRTLSGHRDSVVSVAFSADGKTLASASRDESVILWDIATGKMDRRYVGHTHDLRCVAFSPSQRQIATASNDRTIKLWDLSHRRERVVRHGHTDTAWQVAFSPDGTIVATSSADHSIKLWNVEAAREMATLTGHRDEVNTIAFSPDGKTLASGSDDGTVRLWDVAAGKQRATVYEHAGDVNSVTFSPDGRLLASGSRDRTVNVFDLTAGKMRVTLRHYEQAVTSVSFSPDGTMLATASRDGIAVLWDVASWRKRARLIGHRDTVVAVAFSPDSQTLATASRDTTIKLWNVATARLLITLEGHANAVRCLAFFPDGETLVSGSNDGTIKLWDVATGEQRATLQGEHAAYIQSVAIAPNGKALASCDSDGQLILRRAATEQQVIDTYRGNHSD